MAFVAMPILCLVVDDIPASAQSNAANYAFLVGSGFLCDFGDSASCPAVVRSADGDSYEVSGAGALGVQSKVVMAAGTFTHRSPEGNEVETGIWIANELVSFDSYGVAPNALRREGWAFGSAAFGLGRRPTLSGSMPSGGLAVMRIRLLPMWGPSRTAVLQVNCALGKVPDEHPVEGIRLAFEGGGVAFDEEISGRALFVLTRPGASVAPKKGQPPGGDQTLPPLEPKP
jgi:hypothetical protein